MNLLRLPQELLVGILLNLGPSDLLACGLVCHGLNSILGTPALRHQVLLAKAGMRQTISGELSLLDNIKALEEYQTAWRSLTQRTTPHTDQHDGLRYLKIAGDALALLSDKTLRLIRPPCSIRRVQSQTWSIDLSVAQFDIHCCAVDSSQGLIAISGVDMSSPQPMQCHLVSLSGASLRAYHPDAAVQAFTIPTYVAYAWSREVKICGDLVGWVWRDHSNDLRVYNWKTGALVWQHHSAHDAIHFTFLDETRLMVACENTLRIYVVDAYIRLDPSPHAAPPWASALADHPQPICTLEGLPLVGIDVTSNILAFESQRPVANDDAAFERDASLTVLAMLFMAGTSTTIEKYLYVIPVATLLGCLDSLIDENTFHAVPPHPPPSIPWDSWGASGGCLLPILNIFDFMPLGVSVMGSTCAIISSKTYDFATLDAFIFDFHALAHPESAADDDREILAQFMDSARVVRSAKLLRGPIRNTLPYRVVHKTVTYNDDPDFAAAVTRHSFALLEDGLAVMSTTMEDDIWRLRLFTVDKPAHRK
ncbi:hypothetical protein C8Q70DRAFT_1018072 [Cubamyces menziesii]|uniref:F-box domain-containing protein n=1 Tax=Trametes cubensis TaxID=1111947 RepID=A0AAD7U4D9_9APHY|nr:hypothetical protein C8Q70DRAFT_1018072 [Cubamyces menziesii]KAJ8502060.1 hypothetical protein ONZ51_g132 [Trametes cubensis]